MVWIKSDSGLRDNPKTLNVMALMGWDLDTALGKLHRFWWWCAENAPDGDLRGFSNPVLASVVGLNPEQADQFVQALIGCGRKKDGIQEPGFLDKDPYFMVHAWDQWRSDPVRLKSHRTGPDTTNVRQTSDKRPTNVGSALVVVSVVVLSFPVSGETKTWELREDMLLRLQELYLGVDVLSECKKALFWIESNPTRRKTARGMPKFLSAWMERQQNRGRFQPGEKPNKDTEFQKELERRRELNERADRVITNGVRSHQR